MSGLEFRGTKVRRGQLAVWAMVLLLSVLFLPGAARATPTPDYIIVNHATKECTQTILGDDCKWCDPPPGWEVLGMVSTNQCPEGYTRVDRIDMQCKAYRNEFCCTSGSHGPGDCDDMVRHEADRLCAFVEDIEGCILPSGWTARPSGEVYWACPNDYRWVDTPACLSPSPLDVPATVEVRSTPSEPETGVRAPIATALLVVCVGAVFVAAAVLVLVVILARRGRS